MADKQSQWRDFINKMESGMSDVSQNANSTINDGSSTDTQKSSAAQDYAKQQMFLTRIKEMYANGDYNNPTNTYSVSGASSIYLSAKDSKYHACAMQPWSDAGEIASGAELTHDILSSDEFVVTSHMENLSGDLTCTSEEICEELANWLHTGCEFCARPYAYWHCWFSASGNYFNPLAESSDIITGDNMGYIMSLYAKKNLFLNQNPLPLETFSSARFWNGTSIDLETCFAFIIDIDSEEMENPWDFYNDDILPNVDPNNAVFPDGYEPPGPYMEWHEVLTYDISCYKDAADETKIKLEFKQPVEKNGNPLKTTTIIFSENENNWAGTVTETLEASEGEIKITPFYLGECLSRRCNNEQ